MEQMLVGPRLVKSETSARGDLYTEAIKYGRVVTSGVEIEND
jgi:hypothetical protein